MEEVTHSHQCMELEEDIDHQMEVVEEYMMGEETKRKKKRGDSYTGSYQYTFSIPCILKIYVYILKCLLFNDILREFLLLY